ncbi:MAG: hypothetical protein P4M13_04920 [Alphaproteobacteria bacterium]|nr:hypothetical protein [Alphaproteobacteria bacterium]
MTKVVVAAALLALILAVGPAFAGSIGAWYVTVEKDPFSPKKKTIAISQSGYSALAIRCFPDHGLTVILAIRSEKHFEPGASVDYKYRADEGPIADERGEAWGEQNIELPNARQILDDALKASVLNFRVGMADEAIVDLAFKAKGGAKALQQVVADCPPEPVADKKPEVPVDKKLEERTDK